MKTYINKPILYFTISISIILITSCDLFNYSVILVPNEGSLNVTKYSVSNGSFLNLPTPSAPDGYIFEGWYKDESFNNICVNEFIVTSNIKLYAKYRKCKIQLLKPEDLEDCQNSTIYFIGNQPLESALPIPILEHKIFENWYLDYEFKNIFNPLNPGNKDINLFPKYRDTYKYEIYFIHSDNLTPNEGLSDNIIFEEGSIGINPPKYVDELGLSPQITWYKDINLNEKLNLENFSTSKSMNIYGKTGKYIAKNSTIKNIVIKILQNGNEEDLQKVDTSNVTSMAYLFKNLPISTAGISDWDVSNVTDMHEMFYEASSFDCDISEWDVSNVTNMDYMFYRTNFNQDISKWDVSKVTTMMEIFGADSKFNQDISMWDVSNVTNMYGMFHGAQNFNQNINKWDVSNVVGMSHMFTGAYIFNKSISDWNVSNVQSMSYMFYSAKNFNQDITKWNVSNVINMDWMFHGAFSFYQNISDWNVNNVKNHYAAFYNSGIDDEKDMQPSFFYL